MQGRPHRTALAIGFSMSAGLRDPRPPPQQGPQLQAAAALQTQHGYKRNLQPEHQVQRQLGRPVIKQPHLRKMRET